MMLLAPIMLPLVLVAATSLREQSDVVSLRFKDSLLGVESVLLQGPPAPGNTHRLWLFNRPRHGGFLRGDSYRMET